MGQAAVIDHCRHVAKKIVVHFYQHFGSDTFAEQDQGAGIKRGFLLIPWEPDKVLQVRVFTYLFHQFPVSVLDSG